MKIYNAILHTENHLDKGDKIINDFYKLLDGVKCVVAENIFASVFSIIGSDDPKYKEAIYLLEQDKMSGSYINERERFDKDWDAGEYFSDESILIEKEFVEIVELIGCMGIDLS